MQDRVEVSSFEKHSSLLLNGENSAKNFITLAPVLNVKVSKNFAAKIEDPVTVMSNTEPHRWQH
jgi:hypothetical protein